MHSLTQDPCTAPVTKQCLGLAPFDSQGICLCRQSWQASRRCFARRLFRRISVTNRRVADLDVKRDLRRRRYVNQHGMEMGGGGVDGHLGFAITDNNNNTDINQMSGGGNETDGAQWALFLTPGEVEDLRPDM